MGARTGSVVQPCARCGSRWAVQNKPLYWCPRCRGVLLSPGPVDAPAEQRNYRWVVRAPGRRGPVTRPALRADRTPTPHYREIPTWGLRDRPAPPPAAARRGRWDRSPEQVLRLLRVTALLFLIAACAELGRYLILLRNRTALIDPLVLGLSDWSVWIAELVAPLAALGAAIGVVGWLADTRRAAFAAAGLRDPRPRWLLFTGCLVPVVNLLWPGVYLTELVRARAAGPRGVRGGAPYALRAVRIWWLVWITGGVMVAIGIGFRFTHTLQAQANGVIFAVYTNLVAVAATALTVWVMHAVDGRDLRGRVRVPKRWVPAAGPARPVIAPVEPEPAAEPAAEETEPVKVAAR
ncbi:DUF4328 domain-containing protein [Nocardia stercoris]|uniref:DUF4328 domain-containing protein n=1 Tax=Nocardia stercoris TaxID=2483361 RepID=A0A3M2LBS3_9NOCA|nr:DUF4328 domain-containing protein [Nocardia stercoris]RMI34170.1 DUF4328 domain-containing protein [Nocardia stercoris]